MLPYRISLFYVTLLRMRNEIKVPQSESFGGFLINIALCYII